MIYAVRRSSAFGVDTQSDFTTRTYEAVPILHWLNATDERLNEYQQSITVSADQQEVIVRGCADDLRFTRAPSWCSHRGECKNQATRASVMFLTQLRGSRRIISTWCRGTGIDRSEFRPVNIGLIAYYTVIK